jgi:hypothetical protein
MSLNYRTLKGVLDQMDSVTLDVKYFGSKKLLWIHEDKGEQLAARSVILAVQADTDSTSGQATESPATPDHPSPPGTE